MSELVPIERIEGKIFLMRGQMEFKGKIEEIERKSEKHDQQFKAVFEAIKALLVTHTKEKGDWV